MAKLYAKDRERADEVPPEPRKKRGIPLWLPLLLLLLIPVFFWLAPGRNDRRVATAPTQELVVRYNNHDWVPVADSAKHQVVFPADQMRLVGRDKGHDLYANVRQGAEGGGGGPNRKVVVTPGQTAPQAQDRIYLKTGTNTYTPMIWREFRHPNQSNP